MDPQARVAELEERLRRLTGVVESMLAEREAWLREWAEREGTGAAPPPAAGGASWHDAQRYLGEEMRRGVDRVIGGDPEDTLEGRIGSVWLSRVAVFLAMTAIILGAAVAVASEVLGPFEIVAMILGFSTGAVAYGVHAASGRRPHFLARNVLGLGIAGLYFGIYSAFFVDNLRLFDTMWPALPLLGLCLALLAGMTAWTHSRAVAGIGLFLVYYTVVATLLDIPSAYTHAYALGSLAVLAMVMLGLAARYHWLGLAWLCALISYPVFFAFYWQRPPAFPLETMGFFWSTHAVLGLIYACVTAGAIVAARKGPRARRGRLTLAAVNTLAFFVFTAYSVPTLYPDQVWVFRAGWTVLLLAFAGWAETRGEHRNLLFQLFLFKAALMANLALAAYLEPPWLLIALGMQCLVFAVAYDRMGVVTLKVMNLAVLAVALVGSLLAYRTVGQTNVLGVTVPVDWAGAGGAAVCFLAAAVFYQHAVKRVKPAERTRSGHWFLADSRLDLPPAAVSMLHAAAGALALTGLLVMRLGDLNEMPFLLAGVAAGLLALGVLTRTPQIGTSAMVPLVGASVSFHFFLLVLEKPGFEAQRFFLPLVFALAALTALGAWHWERYLRRIEGVRGWEHDLYALPPFALATVLLSILIERNLAGMLPAIGHNALGLALLGAGLALRLNAINLAGLIALGVGSGSFLLRVTDPNLPFLEDPYFLAYLGLLLITYAAAERLFALLRGPAAWASPVDNGLRSAFVAAASIVGVLALFVWAPDPYRTLSWSALALGAMVIGFLFREARYRWAALVIFALAVLHFFATDLARLTRLQQFLVVAVLAALFLVISGVYARFRQGRNHRNEAS